MTDYSEHIRTLIYAFIGLAGLFIWSYNEGLQTVWLPTMVVIMVDVVTIAILARSGGVPVLTD